MLNTGFELPTRSLPDQQWSLRWPCCRSSFWRPWPPPGRPGSSRPWPCGGRWSRLRPTGWKWHWAEHSPEKVTIWSLEYKLNVTEHALNPENMHSSFVYKFPLQICIFSFWLKQGRLSLTTAPQLEKGLDLRLTGNKMQHPDSKPGLRPKVCLL